MNEIPLFSGSLDSKEASAINRFKSVSVLINSIVKRTVPIDVRRFYYSVSPKPVKNSIQNRSRNMFQATNIHSLVICVLIPGYSISLPFYAPRRVMISLALNQSSHAYSPFLLRKKGPARNCVGNATYKALNTHEYAVSYFYLHRDFQVKVQIRGLQRKL